MTQSGSLLEVHNLGMRFGGLIAVDGIELNLRPKEIFAIIGPNGAGKTTVFNCITQFYKPDTGEIRFTDQKGKEHLLNGMPAHKIIGLGLVRTFQNTEIIRELPIIDNVLLGAHTQFHAGTMANMFAMPWARKQERELRKKAMDVLAYVGLDKIANEYAGAQPYGVLKLIELGRTLMCDPSLIILDEPAGGLNDSETERLTELIRGIARDRHCAILLVEHDMKLVMSLCDRICAISFGKKLAEGTAAEIQQNPLVQDAYLGKEDEA